jgi:hypothetical protein
MCVDFEVERIKTNAIVTKLKTLYRHLPWETGENQKMFVNNLLNRGTLCVCVSVIAN